MWKDKEDWLDSIEGVQDILATCVDSLTQNIFYIINQDFSSLTTLINTDQELINLGDGVERDRQEAVRLIYRSVVRTLRSLERLGLTYNTVCPHTILFSQGKIFLQNQLIVKSNSGKLSGDIKTQSHLILMKLIFLVTYQT